MPLDVVQRRTLQATIWACDRFQENLFLGAVTIPLENIFPGNSSNICYANETTSISCLNSGIKFEKWYSLTNFHREPDRQSNFFSILE